MAGAAVSRNNRLTNFEGVNEMEYWLIGGLAYIAADAWVFRTLRRGWIEQFGRFTRGDALWTLIVSIVLPAGIAIVISEQPRVAEWLRGDC